MKLFDGKTAIKEEAKEDVLSGVSLDRCDMIRKNIEIKNQRFESYIRKVVTIVQWVPSLILFNSLMFYETFFSGKGIGELWYIVTFLLSMAFTIVLSHIIETAVSNHREYYKSVIDEILNTCKGGKK